MILLLQTRTKTKMENSKFSKYLNIILRQNNYPTKGKRSCIHQSEKRITFFSSFSLGILRRLQNYSSFIICFFRSIKPRNYVPCHLEIIIKMSWECQNLLFSYAFLLFFHFQFLWLHFHESCYNVLKRTILKELIFETTFAQFQSMSSLLKIKNGNKDHNIGLQKNYLIWYWYTIWIIFTSMVCLFNSYAPEEWIY